ncbi:hypothetical protein MF672_048930 [Actinomadura sp. ATCC 31491]|uniref:DUF2178 domain-containing protein n=1 Tax=Actinomadura luzonensis TaxID=2805427 RepID=A0ABT0GAP6_9ACTN|nr:hypothetical protein [Actinomadura luzonensis]MCK2221680.1 hypothetical protein [Actinomadura luzonensis]
MPPEEKRAWIMVVVSVLAYGAYLATILGRAGSVPLAEVPYVVPLLWSVGGACAASIVAFIAVSLLSPADIGSKDQRDREIHRYGEYAGQWFLVAGALAALVMAMAEIPHFWIANVLYLGFVLSAVLGSTLKIVAYRRGMPGW